MNFKQFLDCKQQLCEREAATNKVVVAYASFEPFHIGYIHMLADLVKLSEELEAKPLIIFTGSRDSATRDKVKSLLEQVEIDYCSNPMQSLIKLSQYDQEPVVILGDKDSLKEAKMACVQLFPNSNVQIKGVEEEFRELCIEGAKENNFNKFRCYMVSGTIEWQEQQFEQLQEAMNGQQ